MLNQSTNSVHTYTWESLQDTWIDIRFQITFTNQYFRRIYSFLVFFLEIYFTIICEKFMVKILLKFQLCNYGYRPGKSSCLKNVQGTKSPKNCCHCARLVSKYTVTTRTILLTLFSNHFRFEDHCRCRNRICKKSTRCDNFNNVFSFCFCSYGFTNLHGCSHTKMHKELS